MGKVDDEIDGKLADWIGRQRVFCGVCTYVRKRNGVSIDGLPALADL
jgi:hypothetical protein